MTSSRRPKSSAEVRPEVEDAAAARPAGAASRRPGLDSVAEFGPSGELPEVEGE